MYLQSRPRRLTPWFDQEEYMRDRSTITARSDADFLGGTLAEEYLPKAPEPVRLQQESSSSSVSPDDRVRTNGTDCPGCPPNAPAES